MIAPLPFPGRGGSREPGTHKHNLGRVARLCALTFVSRSWVPDLALRANPGMGGA